MSNWPGSEGLPSRKDARRVDRPDYTMTWSNDSSSNASLERRVVELERRVEVLARLLGAFTKRTLDAW
ncbi:hypothetical protein BJF96_g3625 [Verticillium dahliae]|uniref:Uncharacterized protein n=1 Tax=Verticillium dahliae TaxID=27337 RepID=A0AA44WLP3_VERDA|nr:hypothetical protein BJF96_g3625 [Verticillium dahliae]